MVFATAEGHLEHACMPPVSDGDFKRLDIILGSCTMQVLKGDAIASGHFVHACMLPVLDRYLRHLTQRFGRS